MFTNSCKYLALLLLTFSLIACGGSSSEQVIVDTNTNDPTDPTDPTDPVDPPDTASGDSFDLSGSTVKGVIANGVVSVYDADDLTTVVYSPDTRTGADGSYTLTVPAEAEFAGEVIVVEVTSASDGSSTMKCDVASGCTVAATDYDFGDVMPLAAGFSMQAITTAPDDGGSATVYITALTNLVSELALEDGDADQEDIDTANALVGDMFDIDVDDFSQVPAVDLTEDVSGSSDEAQKVAVIGAALLEEGLEDSDDLAVVVADVTTAIVTASTTDNAEEALNDLAEEVFENAVASAQSNEIEGLNSDLELELIVNELQAENDQTNIGGPDSPHENMAEIDQAKGFVTDLRTLKAAFNAEEIAAGADPFLQSLQAAGDLASDDLNSLISSVSEVAMAMTSVAQAYANELESEGDAPASYTVNGIVVAVEAIETEENVNLPPAMLTVTDHITEAGDTISLSASLIQGYYYQGGDDYSEGDYSESYQYGNSQLTQLELSGSATNNGVEISIDQMNLSLNDFYFDYGNGSQSAGYSLMYILSDYVNENCEEGEAEGCLDEVFADCYNNEGPCPEGLIFYNYDEFSVDAGSISIAGEVNLLSDIEGAGPVASFSGDLQFDVTEFYTASDFSEFFAAAPCMDEFCYEPCQDEECYEPCQSEEECGPPQCNPEFDEECFEPCESEECFEPCENEEECGPPQCNPEFDEGCTCDENGCYQSPSCGPEEECGEPCFDEFCGDDQAPFVLSDDLQEGFSAANLSLDGMLETPVKQLHITLVVNLEGDFPEGPGSCAKSGISSKCAPIEPAPEAEGVVHGQFLLVVNTNIIGIGDEAGVTITLSGSDLADQEPEGELTVAYSGRVFHLASDELGFDELGELDSVMIDNQDNLVLSISIDAEGNISGAIATAEGVALASIEDRSGLIFVVYDDGSFESLI